MTCRRLSGVLVAEPTTVSLHATYLSLWILLEGLGRLTSLPHLPAPTGL